MKTAQLNDEEWQAFARKDPEKPVVLLNLLKFRNKTETGESGEARYQRYVSRAKPLVEQVGGRVLWQGRAEQYLIGGEADRWDKVLLVAYPSRSAFMQLMEMPDFRSIQADRLAALERSALIACSAG